MTSGACFSGWDNDAMNALRFLGLLLVAGCSAQQLPPPDTFSIDPAFSPEQAAVLRDGVSAWCDAVDWCPAEVEHSDRGHFILSLDYAHDTADDTSSAYNDGTNIYVAAASSAARDLGTLWVVTTHEAGHYGILGHPVAPPALMAAEVGSRHPHVIDEASRAAWCAEQGC